MLTDKAIRALRPRTRDYQLADPQTPGLALRVWPTGEKSWSFRYRDPAGRLCRVTLGALDDLGLKAAREKAQEYRVAIRREGAHPAREKRERRESTPDTLSTLIDSYLETHAKARKRSWRVDQKMLDRDVPKSWRTRPPAEITRRELRELIERKARSAPIQANRLRALLHKVFSFAVGRDVVPFNPVSGIERPAAEVSRDRVLTEDEIRRFWQATEALDAPMRALLRLQLVTGQRVGEVRAMRWSELDLVGRWWTIPAERSKNGLAHRVPLTPLALEVLRSLPRVVGEDLVLAGARGNRQYYEATGGLGIEDFVGHDLRRTAASLMASLGISREHIDAVLNHKVRGVAAVYVRHSYDPEKRDALLAWERRLREILSGDAPAERRGVEA